MRHVLTVLILIALSFAANAQPNDGGRVQATGTNYRTGVWDLTGETPIGRPQSILSAGCARGQVGECESVHRGPGRPLD